MTYSIAFAGKGGTGKTTLAGFMVRYLVSHGKTPVLAVDADSNSNLNEVLGLEVDLTLGEAREEMKSGVATGMTKDVFIEMKIQEAVVESDGFDLIVMGRPEGPGCYCAANTLLTQCLEKLIANYAYIVMDNEAGMEHISRLTTNNINTMFVVSDPTKRGLQAASRILSLADELNLEVGDKYVLVNLAKEVQEESVLRIAEKMGLKIAGFIPEDAQVRDYDLQGRPTSKLPDDNLALVAAFRIFQELIN